MKALGAKVLCASEIAAAARRTGPGRAKPRTRPPPTAAPAFRKLRREKPAIEGIDLHAQSPFAATDFAACLMAARIRG